MLIIFSIEYFLLLDYMVKSVKKDTILLIINRKYFRECSNSL